MLLSGSVFFRAGGSEGWMVRYMEEEVPHLTVCMFRCVLRTQRCRTRLISNFLYELGDCWIRYFYLAGFFLGLVEVNGMVRYMEEGVPHLTVFML